MTQKELLSKILKKNNGIISAAQIRERGISKPVFYQYVKDNDLQQINRGVYVCQDTWIDGMYVLHLRSAQLIFSHDSALLFHDLTDREPLQYTVTMKTGYNPSVLKKEGVHVYTIKEELYQVGATTMTTSFGNEVPVYDLERTVCDIVRNRNSMEIQVFQEALKRYAKRKDKNLRLLMKYANLFRVEKIIRQYLEVLI